MVQECGHNMKNCIKGSKHQEGCEPLPQTSHSDFLTLIRTNFQFLLQIHEMFKPLQDKVLFCWSLKANSHQRFLFCFCFLSFKTGFLYETVLAVLELAFQTRLTSNTQRSTCLCLSSAGINGMCHQCSANVLFFNLKKLNVFSGEGLGPASKQCARFC